MDFFIQNAYAQGAQQGDGTSFIIMMVLMLTPLVLASTANDHPSAARAARI